MSWDNIDTDENINLYKSDPEKRISDLVRVNDGGWGEWDEEEILSEIIIYWSTIETNPSCASMHTKI